jgi:hypothetical protein
LIHVQCAGCGRWAVIFADSPETDVHAVVDNAGCTCCPEDHHHGPAAGDAATGGVPCRPLTITLMAGSAPVGLV